MPSHPDAADESAETPEIHLSKRFFKATEWAAERHATRPRRGPVTPSLGQVLGIASLVLEDGGTEREAIAAMALDAIGDHDLPLDELRARFGKKIARLLERCASERADAHSDADGRVTRLETETDESVRRVLTADALRELRELTADLRRSGSITFARFDAPPDVQMRRYEATVQALTRRDPMGSLSEELRAACAEVRHLVELDTASAAWRVAHGHRAHSADAA
ncbi:MAG: HD domain-containing protein [Acidimicrobiia bacterium]|jgi:(p)ppGpp synthase/HD superfamily hydrolase